MNDAKNEPNEEKYAASEINTDDQVKIETDQEIGNLNLASPSAVKIIEKIPIDSNEGGKYKKIAAIMAKPNTVPTKDHIANLKHNHHDSKKTKKKGLESILNSLFLLLFVPLNLLLCKLFYLGYFYYYLKVKTI